MPTSWSLKLAKGEPRPGRPAAIDLAESQAISIGRESGECDVLLDSTAFPRLISRLHCRLAAKENEVVLQDCSVNGCSVDGAVIARRAVLSEGNTVVFGPRGSLTEFTYRLERTAATAAGCDERSAAAGGDEGMAGRKRARAEEPAPAAEEPAPQSSRSSPSHRSLRSLRSRRSWSRAPTTRPRSRWGPTSSTASCSRSCSAACAASCSAGRTRCRARTPSAACASSSGRGASSAARYAASLSPRRRRCWCAPLDALPPTQPEPWP